MNTSPFACAGDLVVTGLVLFAVLELIEFASNVAQAPPWRSD